MTYLLCETMDKGIATRSTKIGYSLPRVLSLLIGVGDDMDIISKRKELSSPVQPNLDRLVM